MRKIARILDVARDHWRGLVVILLLTLARAVVAAVNPWPLKILVDYALGAGGDDGQASALMGVFDGWSPGALVVLAAAAAVLVGLLSTSLEMAMTWAWGATGQRMVYSLASRLFDRLQALSLRFHSRSHVGDLLSRITGDTYCVYHIAEALLVAPAQRLLTLALIAALAWQLDPMLTLVLLGAAPVLAGVSWWFGPLIRNRAKRNREARARLMTFAHQTLTAIPIVQAFRAEDGNRRQYDRLCDDAARAASQGALATDGYALVNGLTTTVGVALVLVLGGRRVLDDAMTVGSLLVFVQYARTMQGSFMALFKSYSQLRTAEASVDRILEIMDSEESITEAVDPRPLAQPAHGRRGAVSLEGVTFGYEQGVPVLEDITLEAPAGTRLALVGATGAGKTTLASLVPRFFDPWSGRVTLDGVNVRELRIAELRSEIAMVLQRPFLLPMSIGQNIAYGRADASWDQIEEAARAANADGFIRKLPEGYNTMLGEGGVTLSGGERQRIAIARALVNDVSVVILDEPTSALDSESELVVMDAVERLTRDRTAIIIAHRLSTARRADRIAVLDRGRLVECGTHEQLMNERGRYWRLHQLQYDAADESADAEGGRA